MAIFKPRQYTPRLRDIDLDALWERGIRALIVDLDNTLVAYGGEGPSQADLDKVRGARERGFAVCLISNNFAPRVAPVAELLGVGYVANAKKPLPCAYGRALRRFGFPARRVAIIGDQVLTDVLGANRFGIYTILIDPLSDKDHPFTRISRMIERWLLARAGIVRDRG